MGQAKQSPAPVYRHQLRQLKVELQRELYFSRRLCCGDEPEIGVPHGIVHLCELRVIEQIEEFRPKLNPPLFSEQEVLLQAQVNIRETRSDDGTLRRAIAETRRWLRERARADPLKP